MRGRRGRRGAAATVAATIAASLLTGCPGPPDRRQGAPRTPFPSVLPTRSPSAAPVADGSSQPVADPVYPDFGNPALDVQHYDLALDWQPATRMLTGTATLKIRVVKPVAEVALDFSDAYAVTGASIDGKAVSAARRDGDLVLPAPGQLAANTTLTATVAYRGTPEPGPFPGVRSDVPSSGVRIGATGELFALHEPYGAYTWFPCNDQPSDKALVDVRITAPPGWTGVASGRYEGVVDGAARWHGTEPTSTYLVALAVDRYERHDANGPRGIPLTYWTRADVQDEVLTLVRLVPDMLAWLERRLGPYPFSSGGVVIVPDRSAMETQTMVTIGPLTGYRGETVLLHELAHQWYGDSVGPRTWRDVWLNEGFATYVEAMFIQDRYGTPLESTLRRFHEQERLDRAKAGPPGDYDPRYFGEHNVYYGPALMLHALRLALGDELFFAMAHDWVQHHRNTSQDRASFTAWLKDYTGRDLSAIVDRWLDSRTTPPFPGR